MEFLIKFRLNEQLCVKDPESTELGKSIVQGAIELMYASGFEQFTFRKLSIHIQTTEATIYRYFSSKHQLLLYLQNWYWSYLEFLSRLLITEEKTADEKMRMVLEIITHHHEKGPALMDYDLNQLHSIVIAEFSKSNLMRAMDTHHCDVVFNPLTGFCTYVSQIILELKPAYPYARSLASTLLQTAHDQQFYTHHVPLLTNHTSAIPNHQYVLNYLHSLVDAVLKH